MSVATTTCRICTQEHMTTGNIFKAKVAGINFKQYLTSLVSRSASVQVNGNDELSQMVCAVCKQELFRTYRFLMLLKQSVGPTKPEQTAIKLEPAEEQELDEPTCKIEFVDVDVAEETSEAIKTENISDFEDADVSM